MNKTSGVPFTYIWTCSNWKCSTAHALFTLVLLMPAVSLANPNHLPQPWRLEAVVYGHGEIPSTNRFLHELSYRHSQAHPTLTENGIRGTGGSVSSRRLFMDFRFRQDFGFNDDHQGFLLDIQRSEDLDGTFDRQLVGFRHQLTDGLELWLQGDVHADKSRSDIYFSARKGIAGDGWVHGAWILPDAYFNDKTRSEDRQVSQPNSLFLQWHQPWNHHGPAATTASVTVSPSATIDSRNEGLIVANRSLRGAVTQRLTAADWQMKLELSGERTQRQYQLDEQPGRHVPFSRHHIQAVMEATYLGHPFTPTVGAQFMRLRERGYTGRRLDDEGDVDRKEPTLFGSLNISLSPATTLSPALYLSSPRIDQSFAEDGDFRRRGFTGKLALPLHFTLSQPDQAVLTLNATTFLHKFAFGGGNLQVHWPM